jgi:hypothetical protein
MRAYCERILSENVSLRGFSEKIDPDRLTWHRDAENRIIIVVEGNGWMFQRDNEIPFLMETGDKIKVNAGEYHRIIKGEDDLIVTIIKESLWKNIHAKKKRGEKSNPRSKAYKAAKKAGKKINRAKKNESNKELSPKQKKIAGAAPPPDKITGADFKALQKDKNKKVDELSGIPLRMRGQHNSKGYSSGIYENEDELEEKRKRKKRRKKRKKRSTRKKSGGLTRGYKANRSTASQSRLSSLTKQYRDADTKAEKMAAIRARDAFEKGQYKSKKKSKYNYKRKKKEE